MKRLLCLILVFAMALIISACRDELTTEGAGSDYVYYESAENFDDSSLEDTENENNKDNTSFEYKENKNSSRYVYSNIQQQNPGNFSPPTTNKTSSNNVKTNTSKNSTFSKTSSSVYPTKLREMLVRRSNLPCFKIVGRTVANATSGIELNWGCSSVEFDLECTEDIDLVFSRGSGSNPVFIEIYVDGKLFEERTRLDYAGNNEFTVATDISYGIHRVKVVRQSDCECPTLTLTKIRTYGTLITKAPENNNLYIEFLGDAAQIGWGVRLEDSFFENYNASEQQSTARNKENEDGTLAYPYVAAQKLGADAYVFARQGAGVAATWHTIAKTVDGQSTLICNAQAGLLPEMYDHVSTNSNTKYEPTRTPDVIVIEAGSTDVNPICLSRVYDSDRVGIDVSRAEEISKKFLLSLKAKNPNTKIVWCYGFGDSGTKLAQYVENVVKGAGGANKGIYTLKLPTSNRNGYPSAKEHEAAADVLVSKIKQIVK